MQRMLDLSAPVGAVLQMYPKGHVTMGYAYYLVYDSSAEGLVKDWIAGLQKSFDDQAKIQPPPAPVVEVLSKTGELLTPQLTEEDKQKCTCGHIKRVHVQFQGECCEGACKCAAFENVA